MESNKKLRKDLAPQLLNLPIFGAALYLGVFVALLRMCFNEDSKNQPFLSSTTEKEIKNILRNMQHALSHAIRQLGDLGCTLRFKSKTSWWIPTIVRSISTLFHTRQTWSDEFRAAFQNESLNELNLAYDFKQWLEDKNRFHFSNYPFLMNIRAKRKILEGYSALEMTALAEGTMQKLTLARETPVRLRELFLTINVHRDNLLEDSMREILANKRLLKKKLRVAFVGEPGLDMGGLTREWFLLIMRELCNPGLQLFSREDSATPLWFTIAPATLSREQRKLRHELYGFTGLILGLAMYNAVNLDWQLAPFCYDFLLACARGDAPLATLDRLATVRPHLQHGLLQLLAFGGDCENELMASFAISYTDAAGVNRIHTPPGYASSDLITNGNRAEFVEENCRWLLVDSVRSELGMFYAGLRTVVSGDFLRLLQADELETLICGERDFHLAELKPWTKYDGFEAEDPIIQWFWSVAESYDEGESRLFLNFVTGGERAPVGGLAELNFTVVRTNNAVDRLPEAQTCFNRLFLPPYTERSALEHKLLLAINNGQGFGLK